MAYASAARAHGVQIREHVSVADITTTNGRVTGVSLTDGTTLSADVVVLCAGAWSRELAARAGVSLPLQAVEHMYIVTEPVEELHGPLPSPLPVIRDLDTGIYIKGDSGGKVVVGGFEPNAKCWTGSCDAFIELPEDWEQFSPFMQAALELFPALEHTGVQRFMNGPESFTADTKPLIGQTNEVRNLFVACGLNSVGVMSSAGVGSAVADWIHHESPSMDLTEVDVARVDPLTATTEHLQARMQEAVADQFAMHWPYKQPLAGRGLRKTNLHHQWQAQGAVFGVAGGWERPLWFATDPSEQKLPLSVGRQPWQGIAEREAAVLQHGAVLLDLSAFGKFRVTGPGALELLQSATVSSVDVEFNRNIYTVMLNERAGIEADVTIRRVGNNEFYVFSGGATRFRDYAMLRRLIAQRRTVTIEDVTEQFIVLGVMGEKAGDLLSTVSGCNKPPRFGRTARCQIDGAAVDVTRISYIGEPGFELMTATHDAPALFDRLINAGCKPMGHYALNSCRLEKGFVHWGHDVGPTITPLESGFGGSIDWDKSFTGKEALLAQCDKGVQKKLVLLKVSGQPLLLHDEPVWCNNRVIGLTTSGALGVRTGLSLCFALLELYEGYLSVEVAGKQYAAEPLTAPPYDPDNTYRYR